VPQPAGPMQSMPVWQDPPLQVPPVPQSVFALHALVVQKAAEQTSLTLVPQSAFEPQVAGLVHFALLHSTPVAH
jgi:hypothetical protein